jgi:hypothetical protein
VYAGCPRTAHVHQWVENSLPMDVRDYVQNSPRTPSNMLKNENARANSPLNLSCDRMYVHWREREHEEINVLVNEDLAAIMH